MNGQLARNWNSPRHALSGPANRLRQGKARHPNWKLEDAEARFSEVVWLARSEGPQRVTVRGKDAVVVIAVEALEKPLPPKAPRQTLVAFPCGLDLAELDLTHELDTGRDVAP
jgi:antitoxin Phd